MKQFASQKYRCVESWSHHWHHDFCLTILFIIKKIEQVWLHIYNSKFLLALKECKGCVSVFLKKLIVLFLLLLFYLIRGKTCCIKNPQTCLYVCYTNNYLAIPSILLCLYIFLVAVPFSNMLMLFDIKCRLFVIGLNKI